MRFSILQNGLILARHPSGLEALLNRDGTERGLCVSIMRNPTAQAELRAWLAA